MECREQELSKLLFSTAPSVLLPLLTAVCLSVGSAAIDPRIQFSTYLSGSKSSCVDVQGCHVLFRLQLLKWGYFVNYHTMAGNPCGPVDASMGNWC